MIRDVAPTKYPIPQRNSKFPITRENLSHKRINPMIYIISPPKSNP